MHLVTESMVIPVIVIASWPIIRLRNYVSNARKAKLKEYRASASEAEARRLVKRLGSNWKDSRLDT
jgi:hypothetical protein